MDTHPEWRAGFGTFSETDLESAVEELRAELNDELDERTREIAAKLDGDAFD